MKEQFLEKIRVEHPNAQYIDLTAEELQKQEEGLTTYASAPPLNSLEVYATRSTQYLSGTDFEYYSANQLSSVYDHGGAIFQIVTAELGYGHIRFAKLNGVNLPQLATQHIDLNRDFVVDGWYVWWDASGHTGGTFTYQNTSTNFPSNTMTDSIFIK
nr:DUF4879 domain-containing protein [Sporosarcina limicola]